MSCEEGRTSWDQNTFSPDVVEPCSYVFLRLAPFINGEVNITR